LTAVFDYLNHNQELQLEDLRRLMQQPSVAIQNLGMVACAELLFRQMSDFGMGPQLLPTANYPVLYSRLQGESEYTLLIYGHYDVQPVDDLWSFDPWGAQIDNGRIYGRGAVDDKGAVMAALQGVRAYLATGTPLPVSVIFFIEGEEEIGSPNLAPFMREHRQLLQADALINFDDNVWPDGRPRVVTGIGGSVMVRLEAQRRREFHGMMAPLIENAIWRLQNALATLRAPDGTITIDAFFDDVRPPTEVELAAMQTLPWDGAHLLRDSGQREFAGGVSGVEALIQLYLTPCCNITGIEGGYVRPMRKAVVPHLAAAELDFRTVPHQRGERIIELLRAHLDRRGFTDISVELMGETDWFRCSPSSPAALALGNAIRATFGVEPALQPTYPGFGPEPLFAQLLGIEEQAYSGFGPTEDRLHAPDEYIRIEDYLRGAACVAYLLAEYPHVKAEHRASWVRSGLATTGKSQIATERSCNGIAPGT
jgi:acetylornithine deacetylase/succinyl-diaminopimelate desuccinylase-like protein